MSSRAVGERDPVIGRFQAEHPGQRPVLFHSPYEAAAWSIISARRPAAAGGAGADIVAGGVTRRDIHARGLELHAFPQPDRLADLPDDTPGLDATKLDRLRGDRPGGARRRARRRAVAVARRRGGVHRRPAAEGPRAVLRGPRRAPRERVRRRAAGAGRAEGARARGAPVLARRAASLEQFPAIAEAWRPFRTWARFWSASPAVAHKPILERDRPADIGVLVRERAFPQRPSEPPRQHGRHEQRAAPGGARHVRARSRPSRTSGPATSNRRRSGAPSATPATAPATSAAATVCNCARGSGSAPSVRRHRTPAPPARGTAWRARCSTAPARRSRAAPAGS